MTELKIETVALTKHYQKNRGVENVSLHVRKESIYGLLGPNGAGKSTFLKMLTGNLRPTNGEIYVDGRKWQRQDLAKIGSLIEQPAIYPNLTGVENLQVYGKLLEVPANRYQEVMDLVGLATTNQKRVKEYSLGMQQRLGVGLALLNEPELLILDEPTNGLDPVAIQDLRSFIRQLPSQGVTVILSSHLLSEVAQVADDIGIIVNGQLEYEGPNQPEQNLEQLFMEIVAKHPEQEG